MNVSTLASLASCFQICLQNGSASTLSHHSAVLVRALIIPLTQLANLQKWSRGDKTALLEHCTEAVLALELLVALCQVQFFTAEVCQHCTAELCCSLIEQQFIHNTGLHGVLGTACSSHAESTSWRWALVLCCFFRYSSAGCTDDCTEVIGLDSPLLVHCHQGLPFWTTTTKKLLRKPLDIAWDVCIFSCSRYKSLLVCLAYTTWSMFSPTHLQY